LPSNDYSVAHLTQRLFLHYLEKSDQAKLVLKLTENLKKNIPNIINRNLKKS